MKRLLSGAWIVLCKEWRDALRDRRTLAMVLLSSVAIGPLVLVLVSHLVSGLEQRAEDRELLALGIEHAPTLRDYIERQSYRVETAPADYEARLRDKRLNRPVLVLDEGFEAALVRGAAPRVRVVGDSANVAAQAAQSRLLRLLQGFEQERATLQLAYRGVAPAALQGIDIEQRDLASPAARAAQLSAMLPFFVLMAVLYGALHGALDSTAGERERGSLEPLLNNPLSPLALVVGKWGAVAGVAMLIALLSCLSFLPGQWLVRSESLAALFRFGPREAALFLVLLLPLAGALAAVLMAVAIRCRSFKEAQASATGVVLAVSLLPLLTLFDQGAPAAWQLWVPALAQVTLMGRVLRAESLPAADLLLPAALSVVLALACLGYVAATLRRAATR